MRGANDEPLNIVQKIAAGDYMTFGMYLLQDKNGDDVDLLKKNHIQDGAESVTEAILKRWLKSGAPTCTYDYMIKCLRESGLGALAINMTTAIVGKGNLKIYSYQYVPFDCKLKHTDKIMH